MAARRGGRRPARHTDRDHAGHHRRADREGARDPGEEQRSRDLATTVRQGIRHAYAEYWTCYRLVFHTREQVSCAVTTDRLRPGHDRYPPYQREVARAPRPAFIFAAGRAGDRAFAATCAATGSPRRSRKPAATASTSPTRRCACGDSPAYQGGRAAAGWHAHGRCWSRLASRLLGRSSGVQCGPPADRRAPVRPGTTRVRPGTAGRGRPGPHRRRGAGRPRSAVRRPRRAGSPAPTG